MGVRRLAAIAEQLIAGGRDAAQPAAVIERGTFPGQRVVTATLGRIAASADEQAIRAPAIAVFGEVAAQRERLRWFEERPLSGISVAVTRARAQASELASRLGALGAEVIESPAIRISPLEVELPDLRSYDLLCLTSPNGARLLLARMASAGLDARALAGVRIAAIGPGTAAALREHGLIADVVPERFVAEGLVEALADVPVTRALVARAAEARDVLVDALRERGAEVDVVALYETVAESLSEAQLQAVADADYVTFTSSSTVRFLFEAIGGRVTLGARLVSIGPVTSEELRAHGHEPDVEAVRHDIDGVLDALVADVGAVARG
jgi:uroporphyrinogen III methyltransferase/synthase